MQKFRLGGITSHLFEAAILFLLLLPFYGYFLRTPGIVRTIGWFYIAGLLSYMVFRSPHRRADAAARSSLNEAAFMLGWCMILLWGILPAGTTGFSIGIFLLTMTLLYLFFLSRVRHQDSLADWGLGSPRDFFTYLKHGARRKAALAGIATANILLVAGCLIAPGFFHELLRGLVNKSLGADMGSWVPEWAAVILLAVFLNTVIVFTRYDNLSQACRVIGIYLALVWLAVGILGYTYVYIIKGGWVELDPAGGLSEVGTYMMWGTIQELLFLSYFNTRIRKGVTSPLLSALITAVVFSLFHIPAYTLMTICFLVGIVWALIFQYAPNLVVLGFSHGFSAGFFSAFHVKGFPFSRIKASVGPFNP
ncbi:MAG TPA: CPBP family glutamic-type intramembrane protease [Candidatus Ozemobacteraceae bacterium]|nr:CPBP family glutamic-type intramembrane protease [Candidatus Ozemobacteraceae bacterium]